MLFMRATDWYERDMNFSAGPSRFVVTFLAGLTLVACNKTETPAPAPSPSVSSAAAPVLSAKVDPGPMAAPGELAWQAPAAFQVAPNPNPMRKATYKVTRANGDGEDAELAVSLAGGDPEANIARWEGQFEGSPKAKRRELQAGDIKIVVVEIQGAFMGGGMGGPATKKPGFMMMGAMAPNGGGQSTFFKLTGPEKTVAGARADFESLLKSIKPQK